MNRSAGLGLSWMICSRERIPTELVLAVILLFAGWYGTFCDMWQRWFPAWKNCSIGLLERLTTGDSYYTHGPLVPLVSLAIAVLIYRRYGLSMETTRRVRIGGWIILSASLLLHLMSVHARITFSSGFALIGVGAGLVLLWGGWPTFRTYSAPLLLLVFMVPLPMNWIADLNFALKSLAGRTAVWTVSELLQVPAILDGSTIHMSSGTGEGTRSLLLESACSGLRSLIAMVWIVSLLAAISRVGRIWKIVFLLAAGPLAVGCNTVRIVGLILVAHLFGAQTAGPHHWFHNTSGIVMFLLAIWVVFGLERVVNALDKGQQFDNSYPSDTSSHASQSGHETLRRAPLLLLALAVGLSVLWSRPNATVYRGHLARACVPSQIILNGLPFSGHDIELSQSVLDILQTNDYLNRRYTDKTTGQTLELLIVFSPDNRKGIHPPEVCLASNGESVIQRQLQPVVLSSQESLTMRELVARRGNGHQYYLYVYKCGKRYTPDFVTQQASILVNSVINRNASGALIRFCVPMEGRDINSARALAIDAVRVTLPHLDRGLP